MNWPLCLEVPRVCSPICHCGQWTFLVMAYQLLPSSSGLQQKLTMFTIQHHEGLKWILNIFDAGLVIRPGGVHYCPVLSCCQ